MSQKGQKMIRQLQFKNGATMPYHDPLPKDRLRGADEPSPDFDPRIARLFQELTTEPGRAAKAIGKYVRSLDYVTSWLVNSLPVPGQDGDQIRAFMADPIKKIVLFSFALGALVGKESNDV